MKERELLKKVEEFISVLERGLNHYLDNWQRLQGKNDFPINSNEQSYMAKNIIRNTRVMLTALEMTETDEERGLITESLQRVCLLAENNYADFLARIKTEIAKNESTKREIIGGSLDILFQNGR